jgi:hypothetical protein
MCFTGRGVYYELILVQWSTIECVNVIRCNNISLHLQWAGRKCPNNKERKKEKFSWIPVNRYLKKLNLYLKQQLLSVKSELHCQWGVKIVTKFSSFPSLGKSELYLMCQLKTAGKKPRGRLTFFIHDATVPEPPHYRGFTILLSYTHYIL